MFHYIMIHLMLTIGGHVKWGPHLVILSLEEAEVFCQEEVDDGL